MLWKVASFALILAVSAQHSLPYSRIVSTHATYAALLASIEIFLFLKTSGFSFANALLADAVLASTSASCPENQVGRARGQDGLAPDTEEAPVCLGVSGRWAELGQADKEMGRVF